MRHFLFCPSIALVVVTVIILAGCSGMPPVVPEPTPYPAATSATGPTLAPPASPTPAAVALASAQPAEPSPTSPPPDDRTRPSLSITVDPPQIAWDEQATVVIRASDPAGIKDVALLLGDQVLGAGKGEELQVEFIPGAIDGLAGGKSYTLVARATDVAGNQAEASASIAVGPATAPSPVPKAATATPEVSSAAASPTPDDRTVIGGAAPGTPEPRGQTTYKVVQIPVSTYPYEKYLKDTTDPGRADYPVRTLDRAAYEASAAAAGPRPAPKMYQLLVLENKYIRLGILPELGGRIYEVIFKPTGANEFYSNTVIKPTEWGPGSPPYPEGTAWWPAAGGLEWGFPVEEHGYEFGTVWGFDHADQDDGGVMITLFTKTGPEKPYAVVDIILPPDTAYFVVQPRVVNPLGGPFKFKFWENAMLAPGKANSVSPDLQLIFPAKEVLVHSTGDPAPPQPGQTTSWPVINGRDYSRLGNWTSYFGAFAWSGTDTPATGNFAAVYDPGANEGIVRVFPSTVAKGVKLFAPRAGGSRGATGIDPELWTDDGSTYVELHGGFTPDFEEWVELGPGEEATWSEFWYPVAGIGGVTFANDRAALSIGRGSDTAAATAAIAVARVRLGLFPTIAMTGRLTVTLPGDQPVAFDVALSPDQPFVQELPLNPATPDQGEVRVTLVEPGGETVFEWQGVAQLR